MKFQPLTEQQIRDSRFLKTATYPFTVRNSTEKLPPGGTHTIELVLDFRHNSKSYLVKDSLSTTNMGKLRAAAIACGLADNYRRGELTANDFNSRSGFARVLYKPPQGDYPEKNVVASYEARGLAR